MDLFHYFYDFFCGVLEYALPFGNAVLPSWLTNATLAVAWGLSLLSVLALALFPVWLMLYLLWLGRR
jgi:hypothetical protein